MTRTDKCGLKILKHDKGGLNLSSINQLQLNGQHAGEVIKIGLISASCCLCTECLINQSILLFKTLNKYFLLTSF